MLLWKEIRAEAYIPALLGAVLLVCPRIGVLGWKDFEPRLSWGLVLTVGASLSLAQAMISTETVDWLGQQFILVFTGGPQKPFLVLAVSSLPWQSYTLPLPTLPPVSRWPWNSHVKGLPRISFLAKIHAVEFGDRIELPVPEPHGRVVNEPLDRAPL